MDTNNTHRENTPAAVVVGMQVVLTNGLRGTVFAVRGERVYVETRDGIVCTDAASIDWNARA